MTYFRRCRVGLLAFCLIGCWVTALVAQDDFNARQEELLREIDWPESQRVCIGITRLGTRLWCVMDKDALNYEARAPRILAVCGLTGKATDWDGIVSATRRAVARRADSQASYRLAVVPLANPDGYFMDLENANGSEGNPALGYPPEGPAYNSPTDPERGSLWRFLGWFAPDLLVEVQEEACADWQAVIGRGDAAHAWPENSLASSVNNFAPGWTGTIPSIRYVLWQGPPPNDDVGRLRAEYIRFNKLPGNPFSSATTYPASPARLEVQRRLQRTPLDVLQLLAKSNGGELKAVSYQPALAVLCQARLGDQTNDPTRQQAVATILEPYLAGSSPALDGKYGGSQLAGHLVFADWAKRTSDPRAVSLVKAAADHAFDPQGQPLDAMPFHNEMSDAVFMSCPLLCQAGLLTGDMKYFDMAERHLDFMQQLCLRKDGVYRHSPLCETPWGRGNGFPALGLSLSLAAVDDALKSDSFSADQKKRLQQIFDRFQRELTLHLGALAKFQDVTGMWQQVIDEPGSYRELTATCMIGYSIAEGIRRGWLKQEEFGGSGQRAWNAVNLRISNDGELFDVCTGTGKQKSLRDYLDRTAILGPDERGGAMAMMFASQMALLLPASAP